MVFSKFCSRISACRAVEIAVVCLAAWIAPSAVHAQTPSYVVTSSAGDTSGTCTNQSAMGATPDSACTIYAAFAAVTALNNTGSTVPTITFASSLYGKTITMSTSMSVTGNVALNGPGAEPNAIELFGNTPGYYGGGSYTAAGFLTQKGTGSTSTTLSGLTFNGFVNLASGGVVAVPSGTATVTVTNDTFSGNYSDGSGGAIYVATGSVVVTSSTFYENFSEFGASPLGGGAIFAPNVTVGNSTFQENVVYANGDTAQLCGGAIAASSSATITSSSFIGNELFSTSDSTTQMTGGAVCGGSLTIGSTSFTNNEIYYTGTREDTGVPNLLGGAVYGTSAAVTNSVFLQNLIQADNAGSDMAGGALDASSGSIVSSYFGSTSLIAQTTGGFCNGGAVSMNGNISDTVFTGTTGTDVEIFGGAVLGYGVYTNDTFYGNATGTGGFIGGALLLTNPSSLYNDTIVGNGGNSTNGSNSMRSGGVYASEGVVAYNTVISGNTGVPADVYGVTDEGNNYIDSSQTSTCTVNCTPMLSALGAYGGPALGAMAAEQSTQTMIPLPGSPLLAAGSTNYTGLPATDSRGYPRTTTYKGVAHADIGAAEANYTLGFVQQPTRTLVNTNISPAPTVQIYESGVAFGGTGGTLGIGASAGTPSINNVATTASGLESLSVSFPTVEGSDTLIASIANGAATPVTVASTSSAAFNIYNYVLMFTTAPVTPQASGAANTVTVAIDGSDGYATTQTSNITLTVTGPNGYSKTYGPTAASASNGTVTFTTAALTALGTYTYTASSSGFTSASATQTIAGGTIAYIAAPAANVQQGGNAGTVTVGLYNGSGALDTTASNSTTLTISGAASYSYMVNAVNGVATFNLGGVALTKAGNYLYVASSTYATAAITATEVVGGEHTWVVNSVGTLVELNSSGALVTSGVGTSGSVASYGGVAFDATGNVWSVNSGANALTFASSTGGGVTNYSGGGLNGPASVAVDGAGMVWIANRGGNTVSAFKNAGAATSTTGLGSSYGLSAPSSVVIDQTGGVWVTNQSGNSLTHIFGAATPVVTPLASAVRNGTVGTAP